MASTEQPKLGVGPHIVAALSYIPVLGVLFGIITIVWGLVTPKRGGKRLAAIGAGGIGLTVAIYAALFYFAYVKEDGPFVELHRKLAQSNVNQLVQTIEFYRVQNGRYPESLDVLKSSLPEGSFVFVVDTSLRPDDPEKPVYYFYERVGEAHYYLRGVGPDRQPFTGDDLVPEVSTGPPGGLGLLSDRAAGS